MCISLHTWTSQKAGTTTHDQCVPVGNVVINQLVDVDENQVVPKRLICPC